MLLCIHLCVSFSLVHARASLFFALFYYFRRLFGSAVLSDYPFHLLLSVFYLQDQHTDPIQLSQNFGLLLCPYYTVSFLALSPPLIVFPRPAVWYRG